MILSFLIIDIVFHEIFLFKLFAFFNAFPAHFCRPQKCHMSRDPFNDADLDAFDINTEDSQKHGPPENEFEVHIRIQQRNGRKSVTLVQGLPPKLNMKKVIQYFKRNFCCNGTIIETENGDKVLQVTGDQRKNVADFLITEKICRKEQVKLHGVVL